jgi:hypothetical protein
MASLMFLEKALEVVFQAAQERIVGNVAASPLLPAREPGPVIRMYWAPDGPGNVEGVTMEAAITAWAESQGLHVYYDILCDVFCFERRKIPPESTSG